MNDVRVVVAGHDGDVALRSDAVGFQRPVEFGEQGVAGGADALGETRGPFYFVDPRRGRDPDAPRNRIAA